MKLYNTLTKQIDAFKPLKDGQTTIYSCGPTVYDHIHIGNLRAFIMADTLRRSLISNGYEVKQVMNFTDVDDKTINRSHSQYPDETPEIALKQLTSKFENVFLTDMALIGNDVEAIQFVRATESLPAMQKIITELYQAGFAYFADDGVYFSIKKYQDAGKTYGQLLKINTENTSEARINNDEYDKESAHDFALWKTQKGEEPAWDFELDGHNLLGRPGWHIECSAMSASNLGQPFDIHTGGVDNIFPHHENEIAQSTALTDEGYANYFVHNEHLLVEGKKMSKSLDNFYTLQDIEEKGFDPIIFRLLVLQAHYRSQLNFSWDSLQAAQSRFQSYDALAVLRWQANAKQDDTDYKAITKQIVDYAADDMNTPMILSELSRLAKIVEVSGLAEAKLDDFTKLLEVVDQILGLDLSQQPDISDEQKELLNQRQTARLAKDWSATDKLRDELLEFGIAVRDTANGQIWHRP